MADAPMAEPDQMSHRQHHAGVIVRHHGGCAAARVGAVDEHGRCPGVETGGEHGIVMARGGKDEPVDAALHEFLDEPQAVFAARSRIGEQG